MKLLRWLSKKRNSRAVATLLLICATIGGGFVFAWMEVVPRVAPELALGSFADGYRSGYTEASLSSKNAALEAQLEFSRISQEIETEVSRMANVEIDSALRNN